MTALALKLLLVPQAIATTPAYEALVEGGSRWVCFAYGLIAGAAVASGQYLAAGSALLGAHQAGCF